MLAIRKTFLLGSFLNSPKFNRCYGSYLNLGSCSGYLRNYSSSTKTVEPSQQMTDILQKRFPKAKKIIVNDMSGGCGSMFEIFVETVEFQGLSLVKQHMLINETLKDHIKNMHGLTVRTKVPDAEGS